MNDHECDDLETDICVPIRVEIIVNSHQQVRNDRNLNLKRHEHVKNSIVDEVDFEDTD